MDYYTVSSLYNGNIWVNNTLQSFICFIVLASEPLYEVWKHVISTLTHNTVLIDVIFSLFFKNILLSDSINNPFLKSLWSIWKSVWGETLWAAHSSTLPSLWYIFVSSRCKVSPTYSLKLSCFNLCLLSIVFPSCTAVKSLLDFLLVGGCW